MAKQEYISPAGHERHRELLVKEQELGGVSLWALSTHNEYYYEWGDPLSDLRIWGYEDVRFEEWQEGTSPTDTGILFNAYWSMGKYKYDGLGTKFSGPSADCRTEMNQGTFLFVTGGGDIEKMMEYLSDVVGKTRYMPVRIVHPGYPPEQREKTGGQEEEERLLTPYQRFTHVDGGEIGLHRFAESYGRLVTADRQDLYVRLEIQSLDGYLARMQERVAKESAMLDREMFGETADYLRQWALQAPVLVSEDAVNPIAGTEMPDGYVLVNKWRDYWQYRNKTDLYPWARIDKYILEAGLATLIQVVDRDIGLEHALRTAYPSKIHEFFGKNPEAQLGDFQKELEIIERKPLDRSWLPEELT